MTKTLYPENPRRTRSGSTTSSAKANPTAGTPNMRSEPTTPSGRIGGDDAVPSSVPMVVTALGSAMLLAPDLGQPHQDVGGSGHVLNAHPLMRSVDVLHAREDVRCGDAHLGESRSIRPATRRSGLGLDP